MRRSGQWILLSTVAAFVAMSVACSSSSPKLATATTVSVAFSTKSAPPASMVESSPGFPVTAQFAAVVNNDQFNDGVAWTATCGSTGTGSCGTFSGPGSASDVMVTYTAPLAVPTGNKVTVTATSVTDSSQSVSATITILPAITLSFSIPGGQTLLTGGQMPLSAVVNNDAKQGGATWTLTCGSNVAGDCGSVSNSTTTATSSTSTTTTATYVAPAQVPPAGGINPCAAGGLGQFALGQVCITATTVNSSYSAPVTATGSLTVGIVSVTLSGLTSVPPGTSAQFIATVANDPKNEGVTWSVTCSSSTAGACGTFNPNTTASGAQTTFSAPAVAPTPDTVTVTATSVFDPTKSASGTIVIGVPPIADGTYVFSLTGTFTAGPIIQPYFVSGAFVVSGGSIASGEQDFNGSPGNFFDQINATGSSISVTPDNNIQIVLATSDTSVGANGVETLDVAKVSASRFLATEFDPGASSSGTIDLQTSTAAPSAGYAFFLGGVGGTAGAGQPYPPLSIGGVIDVDSPGAISGNGSVFDLSLAPWLSEGQLLTAQTFAPAASTVTSPDNFGRVEFGLVPSTASGVSSINLVGYIVDSTHIRLVETTDGLGTHLGGTALGQGTNTGNFNNTPISGSSYVLALSGRDANGGSNTVLQVAGVITFNSGGLLSGTLNYSDTTGSGIPLQPISFTGTYSVDPSGRVTLSTPPPAPFTSLLTTELYLSGNGDATVITVNANDGSGSQRDNVLFGTAFLQSTSSLINGSFSGTYTLGAAGTDNSTVTEFDDVGAIAADGTGTSNTSLSGIFDLNWIGPPATEKTDLPVSGNFALYQGSANAGVFTGNGTGLVVDNLSSGGNCSAGVSVPLCTYSYYMVDPTHVIGIDTSGVQTTLLDFECSGGACTTAIPKSNRSRAKSKQRKSGNP